MLDREAGGVNLAGKVKNLFLVTIDVYRLENRKIEVCRVSDGGGGIRGGFGAPKSVKFHEVLKLGIYNAHRSDNFEPFFFVDIFRSDS